MATIPNTVAKRAIFQQEFRSLIESKNIWSEVATILRATAKNLYSPFTSVDVAKIYTTNCVVPISEGEIGVDELILDRHVGNAIVDCKEELDFAAFDATESFRRDLYASVMKRANQAATDDFLADATVVSGTADLTTDAAIREFVISVKANAANDSFSLSSRIDGATVVRAPRNGRPFIAAGINAYVKILSAVAGSMALSTTNGLRDGAIIETPYGVDIINLGGTEDDPDRIIYGTAGVPVMAYRTDMIETDMGEMVSRSTYGGASADLELEPGDAILRREWYISAYLTGKNGIFSDVAPLVKTQLADFTA